MFHIILEGSKEIKKVLFDSLINNKLCLLVCVTLQLRDETVLILLPVYLYHISNNRVYYLNLLRKQ